MSHNYFKNNKQFFLHLKGVVDTLDFNKSVCGYRYTFYIETDQGLKAHRARSMPQFVDAINPYLEDDKKFDPKRCMQKGQFGWMMYYLADALVVEEVEEILSSKVVQEEDLPEVGDLSASVPDDSLLDMTASEEVEDSVEENTSPKIDMDKVRSFPNKQKGKNDLSAYAKEFGIEVKSTIKLDAMINVIEEAISE